MTTTPPTNATDDIYADDELPEDQSIAQHEPDPTNPGDAQKRNGDALA